MRRGTRIQGRARPQRRKKETPAALYKEVLAAMPEPDAETAPEIVTATPESMSDIPETPPTLVDVAPQAIEPEPSAEIDDMEMPSPVEDGPVHRQLIRAKLPRPEGRRKHGRFRSSPFARPGTAATASFAVAVRGGGPRPRGGDPRAMMGRGNGGPANGNRAHGGGGRFQGPHRNRAGAAAVRRTRSEAVSLDTEARRGAVSPNRCPSRSSSSRFFLRSKTRRRSSSSPRQACRRLRSARPFFV